MLLNLIMTVVLSTGEYEVNLIDNNLTKKQCDERSLVLSKITKEELDADTAKQIAFVKVDCVAMKQKDTPKVINF